MKYIRNVTNIIEEMNGGGHIQVGSSEMRGEERSRSYSKNINVH